MIGAPRPPVHRGVDCCPETEALPRNGGRHLSRTNYHARHRKPEPSGHRADPLHEPLIEERPQQQYPNSHMWHSPPAPQYDSQGFRQDLFPGQPMPEPGRMQRMTRDPPRPEPARRVNPRTVTAAVFTLIVAVPALFAAGWIARESKAEDTVTVTRVSYLPLTLYSGPTRAKTRICLVISESESAWATTAPCEAAPSPAGQNQSSPG